MKYDDDLKTMKEMQKTLVDQINSFEELDAFHFNQALDWFKGESAETQNTFQKILAFHTGKELRDKKYYFLKWNPMEGR